MATGVVREPDGTEHEVSFSNPKTEIQVVAVIGPGRLGLEVGRASVAVAPERTLAIPVRIARERGSKSRCESKSSRLRCSGASRPSLSL